jgi:hypothetical protein
VVNGGALGTPSSGTLTNATGLPVSSGISGLGTNVGSLLASNAPGTSWGGYATISAGPLKNSIASVIHLNNVSNYFDGPSVAQPMGAAAGTWFASGTVTLADSTGPAAFLCKLWDGTTVIASAVNEGTIASDSVALSLSGVLASPVGNLRISCNDITSTSGVFNASGNFLDPTITAFRIN